MYQAETPEKIKLLLKDRLAMFDESLPELISLMNKNTNKPVIRYREGWEGIKDGFRDLLRAKESTILIFCGIGALTEHDNSALNNFWDKELIPKRKRFGKLVKAIFPDDAVGKMRHTNDAKELRESRLIPASQYPFECEIHMYDNTLACFSYNEKEKFVLQIESAPITNTMKLIWKIVWNAAY